MGWLFERCCKVCANAITLPDCTSGVAVVMPSKQYCTWPPNRSFISGADPLYGTCSTSMPARALKISNARCWAEPAPADPNTIFPGCARHSLTKSGSVLAGCDAPPIRMVGVLPTNAMGEKSWSTA
ncbi:hypothetical protein D3C71_1850240 [compost metagenome]